MTWVGDYHHNFIFGNVLPGNRTLVIMLKTIWELKGPSLFSIEMKLILQSLIAFIISLRQIWTFTSAIVFNELWLIWLLQLIEQTWLGVSPRVSSTTPDYLMPTFSLCSEVCWEGICPDNWLRIQFRLTTVQHFKPRSFMCGESAQVLSHDLWNVANQEASWLRNKEAGINKQSRFALLPGLF